MATNLVFTHIAPQYTLALRLVTGTGLEDVLLPRKTSSCNERPPWHLWSPKETNFTLRDNLSNFSFTSFSASYRGTRDWQAEVLLSMDNVRVPEVDLAGGADDLVEMLPTTLTRIYWFLIILLCLLAAIMNAGQDYVASLGSTAKSTLSLIALDSIAYFTIGFSAILLVVATIFSKPWEAISFAFLGPVLALLGACTYAYSIQVYERDILNVWLRVSSMTIVNDMHVDLPGLGRAVEQAALPAAVTPFVEDESIALLRAEVPGGIAKAPRIKGSSGPFINVASLWWQQGSAQRVPRLLVRCGGQDGVRRRIVGRGVTHAVTVARLMRAGRAMLEHEGGPAQGDVEQIQMKLITSFNRASRYVVHAKYGNIWMAASKQPGLDKTLEGWWFIGAEIVQGLKAASGVDFISGPGRFENVGSLWKWVDELGFGFRMDRQLRPIADELGRVHKENGDEVMMWAEHMAGLRPEPGTLASAQLRRVATEVNVVATVGLAVKACIKDMKGTIEVFSSRLENIVAGRQGAFIGRDRTGAPNVIALNSDEWPEHELSIMIVEWISEACEAGNRKAAPAPF